MRNLTVGPAVLAAMACFAVVGAPAASADGCTYDAATRTVTMHHELTVVATLVRQGQAIVMVSVGQVPCGDATVRNPDDVVVLDTTIGAPNVIDLRGGAFAPGATR